MDDNGIIELLFSRSEDAIGELDKKYGAACLRLSRAIVGDAEDARECVNDAYLGVWNAIPPERPEKLSAYLMRIVRNVSLKAYRRGTAAKRGSAYAVAMEELGDILQSGSTPEAELEAKELAGIIAGFLDTLSRENRAVFLRRYWFAESCRDIASAVGITEKTVTVRLTRIRKKLKDHLLERGVEL